MINIGNCMFLSYKQIQAVLDPKSAPVKKMIKIAEDKGRLYDATKNQKTLSAIVTVNNVIYLSCVTPKTIRARIRKLTGMDITDEE